MATSSIKRNSIYKSLLDTPLSVPNGITQFTLNESRHLYSFLSIFLYDSSYIRASMIVPRTPSALQDIIGIGWYSGNQFSVVIKFSDETHGTIENNCSATLNAFIRGVSI